MVKVAPSILSADFSILAQELKSIDNADLIHVDIMDGHFVPNISFGYGVVENIRKCTDIPFDVHLMISHPLSYIESFAKSGSDYISVHVECDDDIKECIELIKKCGKFPGLAISPDTDVSVLNPYLDDVKIITVMSVYPGFGGQSFIEGSYERIKKIREMIGKRDILLSVDGGVSEKNVRKLEECGNNTVVAGSSVFKAPDRKKMIDILRG